MMSDSETPVDVDRAEAVQNRVAVANSELATVLESLPGLQTASMQPTVLSGVNKQLIDVYQELVRAVDLVENTIDTLPDEHRERAWTTPRRLKREHSTRVEEQYSGPVLNLALMLLEHNRREWLHGKPDTRGAEEVERHGFTTNQREWLNQLEDAWREYDGE